VRGTGILTSFHFPSITIKVLEVVQDYGLARFVNIDQKNGGGYLRENTTWAKQSIAHNTLVINEILALWREV
jgi:hypothetical protein